MVIRPAAARKKGASAALHGFLGPVASSFLDFESSLLMASKAAHKSTGWAAGVIAAALVAHSGVPEPRAFWCALAFLMAFSGGTAPDWLELAWWSPGKGRQSWIAHRTWTHWGVLWIAAALLSYFNLRAYPGLALVFGFTTGGIMHLLADWPNPMGIPWLLPNQRVSLRLWKSGNCDFIVVSTAWLAAAIMADQAWFDSAGAHALFGSFRTEAIPALVAWGKSTLAL